ncbi:hypothetical protein CHARACLAT_033659 [Characodon lateralis]|uniref:Tc1-like transposase DDE domain-containing protein n=1 Tax=Characodon lateralis TaxID=208331 RepID=A0ABU7DXK2_9TELE|nr:hypothetical protein [Characodon lateralis]
MCTSTQLYPEGGAVYQDDNAPIHTARLVKDWFDEQESEVRIQCLNHWSPRFVLLGPLKPTFDIGMSDQRFGYSSPAVYIDPVELPMDSSGGNRRVEVHI